MESGFALHPESEVKQKPSVMRTIVASLSILIIALFAIAAVQPTVVTGKVTDEQGTPVAGVNISVKHTSRSTLTDINGDYVISLSPQDRVLVFACAGYQTKEVALSDKTTINVTLLRETKVIHQSRLHGYLGRHLAVNPAEF